MKKNYHSFKVFVLLLSLLTFNLNAQIAHTESFDGATFVPAGWTHLNVSSSAVWGPTTAGSWPVQSPHSGPGEAYFNSFSNSTGVDCIITPPFTLVGNTAGSAVSFWMYRDNGYNSSADKVDVYYNTAANLTGANLIGTVNRASGLAPTVGSNGWYLYTFIIPSTVTNSQVYVVFKATSAWGDDIYFDDVTWTEYPIPCSSAPVANSVLTPTYLTCPSASVGMNLATTYTNGGLVYQWYSSTISQFGPWTTVSGATLSALSIPSVTTSTYYQAVINCTNVSLGTTSASAGQVTISPVITNTPPYNENFDNIGIAGRLPNCSWSASNLGNTCLTYTSSNTLGRQPNSGSSFATFYNGTPGANYFYTNGIYLTAGVTYSAGLWYETEYYGYTNWTDLSILYGTAQTPTGLISIVSTNGPANSSAYKKLGNTFQVATTGLYYIAVRGTAAAGSAPYLSWDDLSITIPCSVGSQNTPTVNLSVNTTTICKGDGVNLTATGADTFTWNTTSNTNSPAFTDYPQGPVTYVVVGTNTLTGCTNSATQMVIVNNVPNIFVYSNTGSVCAGSSATLQAFGASSYVWSNGLQGASIKVSPTVPTTYSVIATSPEGCVGTNQISVGIFPSVAVSASSSRSSDNMCVGETALLTAVGSGISFLWYSNTSPFIMTGNPVTVSPNATTIFSVVATDANGCQKVATVAQTVGDCTGIAVQTIANGLSVYPNPTSGIFSVQTNNTLAKNIEVVDLTGKVVFKSTSDLEMVKINIQDLSNGVYYVKVLSNNSVNVLKIVKQ